MYGCTVFSLIHPLTHEYLGCFQVGATVSHAIRSIYVQSLCRFSFLPRSQEWIIVGSLANCDLLPPPCCFFFSYKKLPGGFAKWTYRCAVLPVSVPSSPLLESSSGCTWTSYWSVLSCRLASTLAFFTVALYSLEITKCKCSLWYSSNLFWVLWILKVCWKDSKSSCQ